MADSRGLDIDTRPRGLFHAAQRLTAFLLGLLRGSASRAATLSRWEEMDRAPRSWARAGSWSANCFTEPGFSGGRPGTRRSGTVLPSTAVEPAWHQVLWPIFPFHRQPRDGGHCFEALLLQALGDHGLELGVGGAIHRRTRRSHRRTTVPSGRAPYSGSSRVRHRGAEQLLHNAASVHPSWGHR